MSVKSGVPGHVAIIMDGNGRWARSRGLPKIAGHRAGVKAAEEAMKAAAETGVGTLTLYTFSTENWKRPAKEVEALFGMLGEYLDKEADKLNKNNIRLLVTGDIDGLPDFLKDKLRRVVESTKGNNGLTLNLALNYGGRSEIIQAVRRIAGDVKSGRLAAGDIDESIFTGYLYTHALPDPELLIRTSGECRVSNFLLWQIAYTELCVLKKLWPDFRKRDFKKAIADFKRRERRFGG
jgi:undecaprenyl diphosphate synthase